MTEFDGLVCVVTGGASGIGYAIAQRLAEGGAQVAILDLDLSGADPSLFRVHADISDDASVRSAIADVIARFGRLDVVVNNAGIGAAGTIADNEDDEWARVLSVNV